MGRGKLTRHWIAISNQAALPSSHVAAGPSPPRDDFENAQGQVRCVRSGRRWHPHASEQAADYGWMLRHRRHQRSATKRYKWGGEFVWGRDGGMGSRLLAKLPSWKWLWA